MMTIIRTIKLLISIIFFILNLFWCLILQLFRIKRKGTCVVIFYHGVTRNQCGQFSRQMDDVVRFSVPIAAEFSGSLDMGNHYLVITFDDGFSSVVDHALPELIKRNIPSTIFVPTGYLGKWPGWISNFENNIRPDQMTALVSCNPMIEYYNTSPFSFNSK